VIFPQFTELGHRLGPVMRAQLADDVVKVNFHGVFRKMEFRGDRLVL
jgi:hypothetical protein